MFLKKIFALPANIYNALKFARTEQEKLARYKAGYNSLAHFGENTKIEPNVYISHPSRVYIGNYCTLQNRLLLHSMGGIHIGNYVGIGYGTIIVTFVHNYNYCTSIPYDNTITLKPVVIRDFVWIGWNCMINPGVEIGEGAVIGMGAMLNKDVPPLAIVMGNPGEVVGFRSKEHFEHCKREGKCNSHRILETFGRFNEKVPLMVKRKYARELLDLGLYPDA